MTKTDELLLITYQLWYSTIATTPVTATASLSGTLTKLPDVPCKAVTFLTACNVSANNGDTIAIGAGLNFPCQNTNQLSVSGSGTLNYIILR